MIRTATPTQQVSKKTPSFVLEAADRVFGDKDFLPLATFAKKMGMDRKTILQLISDGLLDVFEYNPGSYRKRLVSKVCSFGFLNRPA